MKNSDSYWTRLWFQMWNDCSTFSEICDWEENIIALNLFVAYYAFLFNKIFKGVPKLTVTFKQTQTIQILFFSCGSWWWFKIWVCLSSRTCEGPLCFTTYSISCYFLFFLLWLSHEWVEFLHWRLVSHFGSSYCLFTEDMRKILFPSRTELINKTAVCSLS